jgi:hypothetical protein
MRLAPLGPEDIFTMQQLDSVLVNTVRHPIIVKEKLAVTCLPPNRASPARVRISGDLSLFLSHFSSLVSSVSFFSLTAPFPYRQLCYDSSTTSRSFSGAQRE